MKKTMTMALLLIAILFAAASALADMYKWVDEKGVVHFSDTPPKTEKDVETYETSTYQEPPPKPAGIESEATPSPTPEKKAASEPVRNNKVEIFTTSWCRYCKDAIAFLKANRIDYQQYDIEKDPQAAQRMRSLGGTGGVPFAVINGNKIYGYSAGSYKRALGLN